MRKEEKEIWISKEWKQSMEETSLAAFYVIWNIGTFLERERKVMYEKIREIYTEQARDREEDEISVWLKKSERY